MKISFTTHKFLLLLIAIFCVQVGYSQTTYTVTSTSVGPKETSGTFLWAVEQANTNPGADTIEFTPGLQVNAQVLDVAPGSIMARITDPVTIDGKDGALNGLQQWFGQGGIINSTSSCPGSVPGTFQLAFMPGFLEIGTNGQDNSAINVSIKNLTIKQFNQVARINQNASLILDNFTAKETWASLSCVSVEMIQGLAGSSLTIKNSLFNNAYNWGVAPFAASISMTTNAGDLIIENSRFFRLNERTQPAIIHFGATGSKVNIVSSRFYSSGGITTGGGVETNIVNSILVNKDSELLRTGDLIINGSSGAMNIVASSIMWNSFECDALCQQALYTDLIQINGSGNINLSQSAIGFNYPASTGATTFINTLGIGGGTGVFTADIYTYIQPSDAQDAAALRTITSQPALLTGTAFNSPVTPFGTEDFEVEMVTPAVTGQLIDVIPTGNPLLNPIDGSTITLDVVGNPREDANSERDIGAIQLGLAPFLRVSEFGDGYVKLSWNEPLHHDGLSILKYELSYSETGSSSPTTIDIDPPALSKEVTGLTSGTAYEFKVRAVYNNVGVEENGPYSSIVNATPYGPLEAPVVTAVPGDGELVLSWTKPDLGGRVFDLTAYTIQSRVQGAPDFGGSFGITDPDQTSITVQGLTNGTTYEYRVIVFASGETSQGTTTATPLGPLEAPVVTAVPGDGELVLSWTKPDLGGRVFDFTAYTIQQRVQGEAAFGGSTGITDPDQTSITVVGLTNGTTYEFRVTVFASGDTSQGTTTATPLAPIVAGADAVDRYPSQSVKVSVATLLSNDIDPATGTNAGLSITAVNNPGASPATVTLSGGTVFYSPNGHLTADTFEYTVQNSAGETATGTVTVSLIVDNEPSQNVISFQMLGDGSAETVFGGIPGRTYRIQTSENLINWTDRATVVADGVGRVMFTDPPPLVPSRFYRTVSP